MSFNFANTELWPEGHPGGRSSFGQRSRRYDGPDPSAEEDYPDDTDGGYRPLAVTPRKRQRPEHLDGADRILAQLQWLKAETDRLQRQITTLKTEYSDSKAVNEAFRKQMFEKLSPINELLKNELLKNESEPTPMQLLHKKVDDMTKSMQEVKNVSSGNSERVQAMVKQVTDMAEALQKGSSDPSTTFPSFNNFP